MEHPGRNLIWDWCVAFEERRRSWTNKLVYALLCAYGFEDISLQNVVERRSGSPREWPTLTGAQNSELLLKTAKEILEQDEEGRSEILEKCRVMFHTSSFVIPLSVVLVPVVSDTIPIAAWFALVPALCFVCFTLVLVGYLFDTGIVGGTTIREVDKQCRTETLQIRLAERALANSVDAERATNMLVNVFKATRFYFLTSCFLAMTGIALAFTFGDEEDEGEKLVAELRGDPELVELLRGPKGKAGPAGEKGPKGERGSSGDPGPAGERGADGRNGVVDYDLLVDRLSRSEAIREAVEARMGVEQERGVQPDESEEQRVPPAEGSGE